MDTEFVTWLTNELEKRGWSNSELARRAGLVPSTISMVISQQKRPGLNFCVKVAQALNEPPEHILRLAELLPPAPTDSDLDITPDELQAINLVRAGKGKAPVPYLPSQSVDDLIAEIHTSRPNLDLSFLDGARGRISEELIQLLLQNILAIISGGEEETRAFIELHRQAGHTLSTKLLGEKDEEN